MDWRNLGIRVAIALVGLELVLLVLQFGFTLKELPLDEPWWSLSSWKSLAQFFYLPNPTDTQRLTLLEVLVGVPALSSLLSRGNVGIFIAPVGMMYAVHIFKLPIGEVFPKSVGEFAMLGALAAVVAITHIASPILGKWVK
jgi:hypothetical protein